MNKTPGVTASAEPDIHATLPAVPTASLARSIILSRYGALLVAWVAMCGSLFFSDVIGWLPCGLCWYQRILMYPLALLLPVGILRRDRQMHLYVLPFSLIGMGMSLYHYLLVRTDLFPTPNCAVGIPCTVQYLNLLGFINIPLMALVAFVIISLAMAVSSLQTDEMADAEQEAALAAPYSAPLVIGGIIGVVVVATLIGAQLW